ncbi:MAG TPA: hypothetical protein VMA34_00570 [Terracidiphilus sp.]|nr:hypothetical protein [Terracidiphilus sp.]
MGGSKDSIRELPPPEARWALIERVAGSTQLRRAARLQELLLYLGRCSLKEGGEKIHEQKIGVDVFGRPEAYDTSVDNIVRTSVSELRKRLEAYFESEGRDEALVVEIPRWNYTPVFRSRLSEPVSPSAEPPAAASGPTDAPGSPGQFTHRRFSAVLAAGGIVIAGLIVGCVWFYARYNALYRSLYPWRHEPAVAEFWTKILETRPNTDVVLADASFGLLQDIGNKRFPFDEYLNRSYVAQLQAQDLSPQMRAASTRIALWNLGSQDEFKLALRLMALDPLGRNIHLYSARDYMPDLTTHDNVILIGGSLSNPWDDLFEDRMNFVTVFASDGSIAVSNRAPAPDEQAIYRQTPSVEYCVIAYLPNPDHDGVVLLIEGTDAEATEAAGDFLLSEYQLSNFAKMLHVGQLPYFEVVLKVSSVPGTPLSSSIEAYRAYPKLH